MKPREASITLLKKTRSKAKMYEFHVPKEAHIQLYKDPAELFRLAVGLLGDAAAKENRLDLKLEQKEKVKKKLIFTAYYFDAYFQSQLGQDIEGYSILLGAAAYYLCDIPGSSRVFLAHYNGTLDIGGDGLDLLIGYLLVHDKGLFVELYSKKYQQAINQLVDALTSFEMRGEDYNSLISCCAELRDQAYYYGTPRELLCADVACAITKRLAENSVWRSLPKYSNIPKESWQSYFQKENSVRELWPAQHILGRYGVLQGRSAVVQMPTSAGKTKAVELILRSSFLAKRLKLAVIIAPFRALCHEIKNTLGSAFKGENIFVNELSDVLQNDFSFEFVHEQVLIMTPEKLVYTLRHQPNLANLIQLVIFDEGHQFDSGTRGITYELLLTSLRALLPESCQKILISAVMPNAQPIGDWLNHGDGEFVSGTNLTPTHRSIGFASWLDSMGQIAYIDSKNPDNEDFYVPRVIIPVKLERKPKERKDKFFPEKGETKDIALYLTQKLCSNGSVAIFCGKKDSATSLCKRILELEKRGYIFDSPSNVANQKELTRLSNLIDSNLGSSAISSQCAQYGIFSHHGNTPHGIRLAVEHAMSENLIGVVICTSTLAQGVNLPIRYLIVSATHQGKEEISVRDFHNLIGRAGRSGMHTEGSILFSDPKIYDERRDYKKKWRWQKVKKLLNPENAEACVSSLSNLIPLEIHNDRNKHPRGKNEVFKWDIVSFANSYILGSEKQKKVIEDIHKKRKLAGFTKEILQSQFDIIGETLAAIESYLLSHWNNEEDTSETDIIELAEATLAYSLGDDEAKKIIISLFKILSKNIAEQVEDPKKKQAYGKTVLGVQDLEKIENWLTKNLASIVNSTTTEELMTVLWPLFKDFIKNKSFKKCTEEDALLPLTLQWMNGDAFYLLLKLLRSKSAKLRWGKDTREYTIEHVVDICENGLAYDGSLLLGTCSDLLSSYYDLPESLVELFELSQKQMRYGLQSRIALGLYELGYADRVIAFDLANNLTFTGDSKRQLTMGLKTSSIKLTKLVSNYPAYYIEKTKSLLNVG